MEYKYREPSNGLRRRHSAGESGAENASDRLRVESLLTEDSYQTVKFFPVDRLIPFKNQWRSHFDEEKLGTLAETIRRHGVRQPLTVIESETEPQKFEIVSGERRYRAAIIAGLDKVPCVIIHNRQAAEEIALIENLQREDLHPIELGRAYKSLLSGGAAASQSELAEKIGVQRTQISEYLHYADIPVAAATLLIENKISQRGILRRVAKCKSEEEMIDLINGKGTGRISNHLAEIYTRRGVVENRVYAHSFRRAKEMIQNLEEMLAMYRRSLIRTH